MPKELLEVYATAQLFLIQMQVYNVHEMRGFETRLEKMGTILYSGYVHGTDDWYRPTIRSSFYVMFVPQFRVQALKAMITLFNKNNESQVSYLNLKDGLRVVP